MMMSKACIVSDSSLLCTTLAEAFGETFKRVEIHASLDTIVVDHDWEHTVLVVDAFDPEQMVEQLLKLEAEASLDRTAVLLRSSYSADQFSAIVGMLGAVLPADCTIEEAVLAAKLMRPGLCLVPAEVLPRPSDPADAGGSKESEAFETLTERELAVLSHISEGSSNKVIARSLHISDSTVRVHVRAVLRKLGLQNRTQAALYVMKSRAAIQAAHH